MQQIGQGGGVETGDVRRQARSGLSMAHQRRVIMEHHRRQRPVDMEEGQGHRVALDAHI